MANPGVVNAESELLCSYGLGLCSGSLNSEGRCRTCRQKSKGQTREQRFGRINRRDEQFAEAQRIREALVEDPELRAKTRLLNGDEVKRIWGS